MTVILLTTYGTRKALPMLVQMVIAAHMVTALMASIHTLVNVNQDGMVPSVTMVSISESWVHQNIMRVEIQSISRIFKSVGGVWGV